MAISPGIKSQKAFWTSFFDGTWNCYEEYSKRDMLKNKFVTVYKNGNAEFTARAQGISPDFGLKLLKDNGTETILQSGEVSVRTQ